MEKLTLIKEILSEQTEGGRIIPVDLTLVNGNLLVRGFQILSLNDKKGEVKGITRLESYACSREKREPVFCYLKISEIRDIYCAERDQVSA